jgi:uncharacterized protein (DUF1330 family)
MPSVNPTPEQMARFLEATPDGVPIVMINLLRFRERAEYPPGASFAPCSGREAYGRYGAVALGKVQEVGGRAIWGAAVHHALIAPRDERWDEALLVEYPSRSAFLRMVSMPDYQAAAVHRTAALLDSRLLATIARP